ncbi:unnamed protein product, partial [Iphiclides podalirius]
MSNGAVGTVTASCVRRAPERHGKSRDTSVSGALRVLGASNPSSNPGAGSKEIVNCLILNISKISEVRQFAEGSPCKQTQGPLEYPESVLNFTERSTKHGYISDEHTVLTEDGYILTVFHMRSRENCSRQPGRPLILMHGLLMSSDTWLDAGPGASLAYLLADACFDLWLGNIRGNCYGRRHATLDPDADHEFWDFSVDEMGAYDVPAIVDHVLNQTGSDRVDYIGYSQGGGEMLIMCSERPSLCNRVRTFIAVAPATRLTHSKSWTLRVLFNVLRLTGDFLGWFRFKELFPKGGVGQILLSHLCQYDVLLEMICRGSLSMVDSEHEGSIKAETLKVVHANFPSGTSVRTFVRYGQALRSEGYRKMDYGEERNLKLYGVATPPYHNISAVTIPTVIVYGRNDYIIDRKDVEWLANSLPNVLQIVEVCDPMWNHFDFMYSQHTKAMVFPTVLKYLTRASDS